MPLNTLSPQKSYRRLRTAFTSSPTTTTTSQLSPTSPTSPLSPTTPISLTSSSSSPTLSYFSSSSRFGFPSRFFNLSAFSRSSVNTTSTSSRLIRRSKSTLEMEQEEELLVMGDGLVGLIEPRPWGMTLVVGGIEEVLEGRV